MNGFRTVYQQQTSIEFRLADFACFVMITDIVRLIHQRAKHVGPGHHISMAVLGSCFVMDPRDSLRKNSIEKIGRTDWGESRHLRAVETLDGA